MFQSGMLFFLMNLLMYFFYFRFNILGFVAIGIGLNVKALNKKIKNAGKGMIFQYLIVQIMDIFTTLGWSFLMFETLKH